MNLQTVDRLNDGPPVGGVFDLNIILNFGKQWPEMKDFAYETRTMLFDMIYNVEHIGAIVLGFILGVLLTTVVFIGLTRRRATATSTPALLLALLFAGFGVAPAYAQDRPNEPQVDLLTIPYVDKNFGSSKDGSGMCVYNSFRASLVSQYRNDFDDYARWLAANFPGGGYPSRVTEYTRAYCRAKGIEGFEEQYVQIVGEDTIEAMEEALQDGRSPAFTYSGDPSFYGGPVPHMVNLVYADRDWWGVVDNNRPDRVEWVRREIAIKRHKHYDAGWCILYLGKPQLSRPVNRPPDPPNSGPRYAGFALPLLFAQCPGGSCPPSTGHADDGHTWHDQGNGVWYLMKGNVRLGEYHANDGRYYTYLYGGGLTQSELKFKPPTETGSGRGSLPTGVLYGKFPEVRRGQTLYAFGGSAISDMTGGTLYRDRVKRDRQRARVVVNGSADLETRVRAMLRQLKSDAFVYGREALDVIGILGYGKGVTVLQGAKNGVSWEVSFFRDEPSDIQLRDALLRADPSYRPGGGLSDAVDAGLMTLGILLALLVVAYIVVHFKGGTGDR